MLERLKLTLQILLVAVLSVAVFAGLRAQDAPPPPEGKSLSLVITGRTARAWSPLNPLLGLGTEAFSVPAEAFINAHPEAFRVDAGLFSAPQNVQETSYDKNFAQFFSAMDYDAVHVTGIDFVQFGISAGGFLRRPPEYDFAICALAKPIPGPREVPLPTWRVAERAGNKATFIAAASTEPYSSLQWMVEHTEARAPEAIITEALAQGEGLKVLLSDLSRERNVALAERFPDLDIIVEAPVNNPPTESRQVGKTWLIPGPLFGEMKRLDLQLGADNRVAGLAQEVNNWSQPQTADAFWNLGLPAIGMSVQPPGRLAERLGVAEEAVQIDNHTAGEAVSSLTSRGNIYVYHLEQDGEPVHVYRLYRRVEFVNWAGILNLVDGWPFFDVLVLMNDDHTIRGLVTNTPTYRIFNVDTQMGQVFTGIFNKTPDQWTADPAAIAGIEEQAEMMLQDLKRVIEVDKVLYPRGASQLDAE